MDKQIILGVFLTLQTVLVVVYFFSMFRSKKKEAVENAESPAPQVDTPAKKMEKSLDEFDNTINRFDKKHSDKE